MPSEARKRLDARAARRPALVGQKCDLTDPDRLLGNRKKPKGWELLSKGAKLDYVATRILAEDRHGMKSHTDLRNTGILSVSQYERRLSREVYSNFRDSGDLDDQDSRIRRVGGVGQGQFSRAYPIKGRGKRRKQDYGS